MRDIEFRAWDKRHGCYLQNFSLDYASDSCGFWQAMREDRTCPDIPEDIEIEQFTGLRDKNGVKIFDGEIMQLDNLSSPFYTVKYSDVEGGFVMQYILSGGSSGQIRLTKEKMEFMISVGNIHQNPELLEKP